ncbi:DUF805 domain-containing protein [Akkermansia sp.]|uniref:DUF805 domain-containing protein n=1 Tax=Akkermansia sp. TaxID=1872421 RepID=UPI0025BE71FB|nr:DUF805 domain-containing protein [Akkermansia sp.]MCC8147513.1 DUF805 domain-containing protein [Akkermansia sp.]
MPDSPATPATPAPAAPAISPHAPSSPSPLFCWKKGFRHYADFRGCASRAEFWWFMALPLLSLIPALAGYILTDWLHIPDRRLSIYGDALTILLWAALIIPCTAAAFRRLHDTGRSGFWILFLLLPFGLGRLIFFYLTLGESKTGGNKYCRRPAAQPADAAGPSEEQERQPFTPFYLYWLISLRKLGTMAGRASRAEFWSFFLLSALLFLPLGYSMIDVDSSPRGLYLSPSLQILTYATHPQDTLILLAHACFNPTFYFFYQSGELSMLSLELLAAVAGLNILFNMPVAVRRLHDSNLSGKFILIPIFIFIVSFLLIFLLRLVPEDMAPYLSYLAMISNLMDLFSILFLSMMLLKSSSGPNEYGALPEKITVP